MVLILSIIGLVMRAQRQTKQVLAVLALIALGVGIWQGVVSYDRISGWIRIHSA